MLSQAGGRAGTDLDRGATAHSIGADLGARPSPAAINSTTLDLRDLSGSIDEFPRLLDRLGEVPNDADKLEIRLAEFTYSAALAVIAQWILARALVGRYEFTDCPLSMRGYLDNIRFLEALMES